MSASASASAAGADDESAAAKAEVGAGAIASTASKTSGGAALKSKSNGLKSLARAKRKLKGLRMMSMMRGYAKTGSTPPTSPREDASPRDGATAVRSVVVYGLSLYCLLFFWFQKWEIHSICSVNLIQINFSCSCYSIYEHV